MRKRLKRAAAAVAAREDFKGINAKTAYGQTAIHVAATRGDLDVCAAVLARDDFTEVGAQDRGGFTAIEYLAAKGVTFVDLVAPADADVSEVWTKILSSPAFKAVNAKNDLGRTLLHVAASKGQGNLCAAILGRKDFRERAAVDRFGLTAFELAIRRGHTKGDKSAAALCGAAMPIYIRQGWRK